MTLHFYHCTNLSCECFVSIFSSASELTTCPLCGSKLKDVNISSYIMEGGHTDD